MLGDEVLETSEELEIQRLTGAGALRVENDPPKALSLIRKAIWRLGEGDARREMERVAANVRNHEQVLVVLDQEGRAVGAAAHNKVGRTRWLSNMAATGEVAGTGRTLLKAVVAVTVKEGEGVLAMAALNQQARGFLLAQGGREQVERGGGRTIVWREQALAKLAGIVADEKA